MIELLNDFADDATVRLIAALILLDFVTGVAAAVRARTFRMGWLSDFLRADVLGKVIPYFAVWGAVRVSGDIEIGGYGAIEEVVGAAVCLALTASVLNSLRDLKILPGSTSDQLAGSDAPPQP